MNTKQTDSFRSNLERLPKDILIDIIQSNKVLLDQLMDDVSTLEHKLKSKECAKNV